MPSSVEAQSLNYWATKEDAQIYFLNWVFVIIFPDVLSSTSLFFFTLMLLLSFVVLNVLFSLLCFPSTLLILLYLYPTLSINLPQPKKIPTLSKSTWH